MIGLKNTETTLPMLLPPHTCGTSKTKTLTQDVLHRSITKSIPIYSPNPPYCNVRKKTTSNPGERTKYKTIYLPKIHQDPLRNARKSTRKPEHGSSAMEVVSSRNIIHHYTATSQPTQVKPTHLEGTQQPTYLFSHQTNGRAVKIPAHSTINLHLPLLSRQLILAKSKA